jgi:CheY-like chemotaxis protein
MNNLLNILLIEDDSIEIMKFNRVINSFEKTHTILVARNGEEAINLLKTKTQVINLIVLDLNMPKINGIDFLKFIKKDNKFRFIPAIILTTSNNSKDILECYEIGIAGYILKPLKYEDYFVCIENLMNYWSINKLISQN